MALPPITTVNLHTNPSLEISAAGYTGGANGTLTLGTSGGHTGTNFARHTATSSSGSVVDRVIYTVPGLVIGQTYTFSLWARLNTLAASNFIYVRCPGGTPAQFSNSSTVLSGGVWTRMSVTCTIPSGTNTSAITVAFARSVGSGDTTDADDFCVTQTPTLYDYFDGNSTDSSWNSTPGLSASTYNGPYTPPVGISTYMPDVKVEIAFNAGYATPAASRTWTDVSKYVELGQNINITHGRQDEFATTDPNKLSLTLDNTDGRFTAGKTGSPYYPNVKIGRPIRVTSTPVGGTPSVRFLGYLDEWPTEWSDGTDAYAAAKLTASSRMARLGFDAELRSTLEEEYLSDSPLAYYTLGEPEGSTAAYDSTGNSPQPITPSGVGPDVVFGSATGPPTDDLTAAQFTSSGKVLTGTIGTAPTTAGATLEFFISGNVGPGTVPTVGLGWSTLTNAFYVAPGAIFVFDSAGTGVSVIPPSTADGLTHHYCITSASSGGVTTLSVYVDGVLSTSNTNTLIPSTLSTSLIVGGLYTSAALAHVAIYNTALSPARIAAHAAAGVTAFANEVAGDRIERYAGYADIPAIEVAADDGNTVAAIDTNGATVIDNMRKVEETESGVLFDARDNTLTFHARARRYNSAVAFTLDVSLHEVEAGVTPKLDRSALVNDVTATASDGSTARAINAASIADYGFARGTTEIASTSDAAFQAASWQVNTYGTPQPRIPSLGVDLLPLSQARQDSLFTLDVSSRVRVSALPTQAPATTLDFFVEGYTEAINHESYTFDFNVSPVAGFDVFTLDDAVKGVLDNTTYRLAY